MPYEFRHGAVYLGKTKILDVWSGQQAEIDRLVALANAGQDMQAALKQAIAAYGRPGGPWNAPSDPGGWLETARAAVEKSEAIKMPEPAEARS